MKKVSLILMSGLVMLSLTACGKETKNEVEDTKTSNPVLSCEYVYEDEQTEKYEFTFNQEETEVISAKYFITALIEEDEDFASYEEEVNELCEELKDDLDECKVSQDGNYVTMNISYKLDALEELTKEEEYTFSKNSTIADVETYVKNLNEDITCQIKR